jgi:phytanoyl-CoA hydroxylase
MSAESFLPWSPPKEGEGMGMVDNRDILMIAGEDPHAWKGTTQINGVWVRPSGEGGCVAYNSKKSEDKKPAADGKMG